VMSEIGLRREAHFCPVVANFDGLLQNGLSRNFRVGFTWKKWRPKQCQRE
jgi:hypothetical protein